MYADAEFIAQTSVLFKDYQLLKLNDIVENVLCIHMFKSVNASKYSPALKATTRKQIEIRSSFHRTSMCKKDLSHTGPYAWNMLPETLRQAKTIGVFKKSLKNALY